MTAMNEILVGIDGSAHSDAALTWAAAEAASRGAGLTIVHAFDTSGIGLWTTTASIRSGLREMAQPVIDNALRHVATDHPNVRARGRVLIGAPGRALVLLSERVQLTVVGRSGRGALTNLWLGSITQRVLAHSTSPAIAVGCGFDGATVGTVSRIVVGMDEGPAEGATLEFGFSTAQRRCVPLEALHVLPQSGSESYGLVDDPRPEHLFAEERQAKTLSEWRVSYPGVAVTSAVRSGRLGEVLRATCRPNDLLVLGHHRHGPFSPRQLGPAATAALHDARCSVAVVREPQPSS
jgi:nucleotide-binding universal stress UspA family protein